MPTFARLNQRNKTSAGRDIEIRGLGRDQRLACIAHKSSEIFERCRLRQQNPPAAPDNSAAF